VSGTVTSQAIGFPLAHGRRVVPSGRLLSSRIRLIGSLTAGIIIIIIFNPDTQFPGNEKNTLYNIKSTKIKL